MQGPLNEMSDGALLLLRDESGKKGRARTGAYILHFPEISGVSNMCYFIW
jgi:hypothetical protein